MSLCCGQNCAQMSKVFRPSNKSNGIFICFVMAAELTVSECGLIHPPHSKPPLVSSSGPPGACMTPSRETNSSTLTFFMISPSLVTVCTADTTPIAEQQYMEGGEEAQAFRGGLPACF